MTDIVERLRGYDEYPVPFDLLKMAADEIERLRAGGCARDQNTAQFCAELRAAVAAENEACAKEMESLARVNANRGYVTAFRIFSDAAAVIRARMEPKP